jgi:subtilisin family serine protease
LQTTTTASTPSFLGLDVAGGLWDQLGGIDSSGEDIIIGVIDSGIWSESESFSDRTGTNGSGSQVGKLSYQQIPGWHGKCTPGEAFPASKCNQKLIGAQRFNAAWGGDAGVKAQRPWEFASPRDYNGHGTHTASTAGGNSGVTLTGAAALFGEISGIAPRARIAAYKALWSTQDAAQASGFGSDLVAAIDQAVADGVDVINYSVSGTRTNFLDPAEISFLFAADAGIFVSASAGNEGPGNFTVAHPSPWITTVAASVHNRSGLGSVTLGSGTTYSGPSFASPVSASLINASAAGVAGADPLALSLCFTAADNGGTAVLDPAKVAGKIVVCDRGTNARTAKSRAVRDAGGVGMILVNTSNNSQNADLHFVPTVHLSHVEGPAIKTYAATAGATASIAQSALVFNVPSPVTAAFSSRGPLPASSDLIKPDVIAPGQDIVAAVAPPGNAGRSFDVYSGTSMSAPHVAGLAALLMDLHPDWTPMMIKSALMTTAGDVLDGPNTSAGVIVRQGAGHVAPNSAANPGLVFNSSFNDWLAFLCGTTNGVSPAACSSLTAGGYSLDPSDFNGASIAIGALAGSQTITRTVTNVSAGASTYTASLTGLTGFTVNVTPSSLTLGPGQSGSFSVTITRTTAALNAFIGGQLRWTDGPHTVRVPMLVVAVALSAPGEVSGNGGPISYNVAFGYNGPFTATARGLVPAALSTGSVGDDPADSFTPTGQGVTSFTVTVPAGTTYARFSLFDANVTPASDLDLYVYNSSNTLVGGSGSATSAEEVNLLNPAADTYTVYVHGFAVPGTANFTLFSWVLGSAAAGNMTVTAPATAILGTTGTVNLTFNSLTPATKYLGSVVYGGSAGMPNPTIVRIDTP